MAPACRARAATVEVAPACRSHATVEEVRMHTAVAAAQACGQLCVQTKAFELVTPFGSNQCPQASWARVGVVCCNGVY